MRTIQRILITTSTFPLNQDDRVSARFVLDLALRLSTHVKVFVLAPAGPGTLPRESWGGVSVLRYRYFIPASRQMLSTGEGMVATMRGSRLARLQALPFIAAQWNSLAWLLRRERIDLVNAHWIVPQGPSAAFWRRRMRIPTVLTAHGADVAWLDRVRGGRQIAKYAIDGTDGFIADSRALIERMEVLVGHSFASEVIPMGVSMELFQPPIVHPLPGDRPAKERVLLFVGKFVPKKGIEVLLQAVSALRKIEPNLRLLMIGGGPLEAAVRGSVARLGLQDIVELRGWVKNEELPEHYRSCDVLCLPSIQDAHGETEGTPVVLQEAMACGALVVASRSSGIADVVRDDVNGWTVPAGDAEALARGIQRALLLSESERERVRSAARATAAEHSWERVAQRYLTSFSEAAARASFD